VLANLPSNGAGRRLLDAGSGFRFFTALLAQRGFDVEACDQDASIGPRLDEVAARDDLSIDFTTQDLTQLRYPDASFDHICCVSVLEHTRDPAAIAREFQRCLKPGGSLLLTFDVSAAGDRDIPLVRVRELLDVLEGLFEPLHPFYGKQWLDESALESATELLRTTWFRKHQPERLPWRFVSRAYLHGLLRGRLRRPFFDLTVIAMALATREFEGDGNQPRESESDGGSSNVDATRSDRV
jgi:SAM-dependent methyltransferase